MGRFVPPTSLEQMLIGALQDNSDEAIGYNAQFFYPKQGGINFWINRLAQSIKNEIYTSSCIERINMKTKTVYFKNGDSEQYNILINTMPLDTLVGILEESPITDFKKALRHLVCNSVVNFNIGIANRNISDKHWIYFPESKFPFYRIGFPHNFAHAMVPSGYSSLYGEFSYIKKSPDHVNQLLKHSLQEIKKIYHINESDIATEKVISISHAYVIYDFWREKNIAKLLTALKEQNIHSVGRYGEWKYSSMQEAVMDGKKVAENLTMFPAKQATYSSVITTTANIPKQKEVTHG